MNNIKLKKCPCYSCDYPAVRLINGRTQFYCNFGDSENYGQEIDDSTGCIDGEVNGINFSKILEVKEYV